jgi:hypothetical protein
MNHFFNSIRSFSTARAVFHHACSTHVKYSSDYVCLWNGCERIKRQKWALISHIQVYLISSSICFIFYCLFRNVIVRKLPFDKQN